MDLRFALRSCLRRPGFTAIAALTLGLGIGGATAVFSIVDAVLLRDLPYRDPSRLTAIWITSVREQSLAKLFATYADFDQFRRHSQTLESISVATWAKQAGGILTGAGPARNVLALPASGFFDTLGVHAAMGRTFAAADSGRGCGLVAAYPFWKGALNADPGIVGKTLTLDQKPCTVLGVMPENFGFYPRQTDAWVLADSVAPPDPEMQVGIFARLKPGVTAARAEAELRDLYRAIHPSGEQRDFEPRVYDLHGEFTFLAGRTLRTTLIVVFGAVLLVLAIACLNVANLMLARLSERRREMAVRAALGSGQSRLVRQVLAETSVLAALGSTIGIVLAWAAVRYFRYASPVELSVGADVRVNLPVLAFTVALAAFVTILAGLLPALRASQVDLATALKSAGRGLVVGSQRMARTVIAVEVGLSFLLLIGAGLLMASALRMASAPLGFRPEGVLATRVTLPASRYAAPEVRLQFFEHLLDRLEHLPGAQSAALSSKVPPEAGGNQTLEIQGRPNMQGSARHDIGADAVTPGFFDLLHIPIGSGRGFNQQDREHSLPITIINEALAREYFPDQDPIGRQIRIPGGMPWLTIVGVCGNLKHTQLMNEMSWVETPILYRPLTQEQRTSVQIVVRAMGDTGKVAQAIRREMTTLDPAIPIADPELLTSRLSRILAYPRFRAVILSFFAAAALLLAAVGLHGVLSQLVSQRTVEFGVRRAVGAQTRHLILLVARQGGVPVVAGLICGVAATWALRRVVSNLLYGIQPADPGVLAIVAGVLLSVAVVAMLPPAVRASRVDPMSALREE
jgi:predicted permease